MCRRCSRLGRNKKILQLLVDIAVDYSVMERFLLQPIKSVLLQIFNHLKRCPIDDTVVKMKDTPMPIVEEDMHMGILRSANTKETAVAYNIRKARRTVYSLIGSGLHVENGLHAETSIHLLQTYVLPVLVYGMEVVTPKADLMEKLERTYKNFIKQILSLPVTVADPAVYVLSGAVPVEAVIHKKALMLFGSVCRLDEDSVEKRIARRQLSAKIFNSNSWFITVRKLIFKYDIPECWNAVQAPPSKAQLKSLVNKHVNDYWVERIKSRSSLYSSLEYLTADQYYPGRTHWLLQNSEIACDIPSIHVKLKLVTGKYILQVNRSAVNQNEIDQTCRMCKEEPETIEHFMKRCSALEEVRQSILKRILQCAEYLMRSPIDSENLVQLLLDSAGVFPDPKDTKVQTNIINIEKLAKILCIILHTQRYKRLRH